MSPRIAPLHDEIDTNPTGINIDCPDIQLPSGKIQIDLQRIYEGDIIWLRDTDEVVMTIHEAIQNYYKDKIFTDPYYQRLLFVKNSKLQEMDETALKNTLSRVAIFRELSIKMKNKRPVLAINKLKSAPKDYTDIVLSNDIDGEFFQDYKPIKKVYPYPYVYKNKIITKQGYNPRTARYITSDSPKALNIPKSPTRLEAANSLKKIEDILCDFGFDGKYSFPNYLGYLLTFPLSPMFESRIPLFCVKGRKQEGKGKLINIAYHIWKNKGANAKTIRKNNWGNMNEEEFEKVLGGILLKQDSDACFDNVECSIESDLLASTITESEQGVRRMKTSDVIEVPCDIILSATGDTIEFGEHMSSRYYICKLASDTDTPSRNRNFKYPKLLQHVLDHRVQLMESLLTLIQYWITQGTPRSNIEWESFPEFASIIGGILELVGIDHFLSNLDEIIADDTTEQNAEFFEALHRTFGDNEFSVKEAMPIASYMESEEPGEIDDPDRNILQDQLLSKDYSKRESSLRYIIRSLDGRVCGKYRLIKCQKKRRGANTFRLLTVGSAEEKMHLIKTR